MVDDDRVVSQCYHLPILTMTGIISDPIQIAHTDLVPVIQRCRAALIKAQAFKSDFKHDIVENFEINAEANDSERFLVAIGSLRNMIVYYIRIYSL